MNKEIDFEAIRATDKMLDEIWINSLFGCMPSSKRKLFIDMHNPEDAVEWDLFRAQLG